MPYVFDRFYQAKEAKGRNVGLGLGLFIVRGLVDAHHGRVWVESKAGEGSTFHIWLPCEVKGTEQSLKSTGSQAA